LVHMCMPAMEPMLEFSKGDRKVDLQQTL